MGDGDRSGVVGEMAWCPGIVDGCQDGRTGRGSGRDGGVVGGTEG